MENDMQTTCSLDADRLERRLAAIAELGAAHLIAHRVEDGRHTLRFRAGGESRRRLAEIVAVERRCCSFLDLSLDEVGGELILSIDAPEGSKAVGNGLAEAFGDGSANRPSSPSG
jgi:hypothetical protein